MRARVCRSCCWSASIPPTSPVQSSIYDIGLEDAGSWRADGLTTRAVATHDRRPCNCVGRGLFQPRRPRGMAVKGPGSRAHRPAPPCPLATGTIVITPLPTNGRRYAAIVRKWIQSQHYRMMRRMVSALDPQLGTLWYLAGKACWCSRQECIDAGVL